MGRGTNRVAATSTPLTSVPGGLDSGPMDKFDRLLSRPHLSGPKRQHYVPRFYLDGFTDSGGKLAVFDRTTGDTRIQTPENSGLIGHFYSFEDKQGRRRFDIEAMFNAVETLAAPVICKLDCRETLKAEEFDPLISFIALAALRTPAAIEDAKAVHAGVVRAQSRILLSDPERVYKVAPRDGRADGFRSGAPEPSESRGLNGANRCLRH